ncbi:MAG: hypothetical protein LUC24_01860, partial [Bacteroidales bacterium]|nr:hypothetical protein [Bacteroidales bacterium]
MDNCKSLRNNGGAGLYRSDYEHDSCGVGMVVNIRGSKSHELVDKALRVLENMEHRGAETRDGTGDGAGILVQIPHEFILLQGIPVPEKGSYGTGIVFLPQDETRQKEILSVMIEEIEREGLSLMHVREVPTDPSALGEGARRTEPVIRQIFVTRAFDQGAGFSDGRSYSQKFPYSQGRPSEGDIFMEENELERTLYKVRKRIERRV